MGMGMTVGMGRSVYVGFVAGGSGGIGIGKGKGVGAGSA